ncbi:MAG TPA: hypothetical protein VFX70_00740 [Mycobacteriales bacterium]|nr:hypothetical protein [Mycobacteriales bacterium]
MRVRFEPRYAELLNRAAELTGPDPLPAELAVSGLLGSVWSMAASGEHRALREGLVAFLAEHPGRPALALLRAAASMGSPPERAAAAEAAEAMAATEVAEPEWAGPAGRVTCGPCLVYGDVFGDQESVVATFGYPSGETHALVVLVDQNLGGIVKDMFCATRAERALRAIRRANAADGPMSVLEEITAGQARTRLDRAFAACRSAWEPPVGENARALWALAGSRLAKLPEGPAASTPDRYDENARAGFVREFLTSPQARTLPDLDAAATCARLVVDHGCDYDGGNPLRISPAKSELFLLYWLPRQPPLAPAPAAGMPAVLEAWVRWAASGQGMSGQPLAEVIAAIRECSEKFSAGYGDSGGGSTGAIPAG